MTEILDSKKQTAEAIDSDKDPGIVWGTIVDDVGQPPAVKDSQKFLESHNALSERLASEQDDRKEERFYWIFVTVMLIDALVLPEMGGVTGSIIVLMEIIMLIGLAKRCGIDIVVEMLQNLYNRISLSNKK